MQHISLFCIQQVYATPVLIILIFPDDLIRHRVFMLPITGQVKNLGLASLAKACTGQYVRTLLLIIPANTGIPAVARLIRTFFHLLIVAAGCINEIFSLFTHQKAALAFFDLLPLRVKCAHALLIVIAKLIIPRRAARRHQAAEIQMHIIEILIAAHSSKGNNLEDILDHASQ